MAEIRKYSVSGMRCTACSANVARRLLKVDGIADVKVDFSSGECLVEADFSVVSDEDVINTVKKLGFEASAVKEESTAVSAEVYAAEKKLMPCAVLMVFCTFVLMVLSMTHAVHGLTGGIIQLVLASVVYYAARGFFRRGIPALFCGAPDMDTLVSLGSGAAAVYSILLMAAGSCDHLHFDSGAMILTLVFSGKMIEERIRRNSVDAVRSLIKLAPLNARVIRDGKVLETPVNELNKGDVVRVTEGFVIPCDGKIISGTAWIDESTFTGESIPVEKSCGAEAVCGTTLKSGTIEMLVERRGTDTLLGKVIDMVRNATSSKAPIARIADVVSGYFACFVMAASAVTFIVHLCCGTPFGSALNFALGVMVVSCPCALGLATPVALAAGIGRAAKSGVLIKSGEALERACRIKIAAFDKTGTLTSNEAVLEKIVPAAGFNMETLLGRLAAAESGTPHPLARAAVSAAQAAAVDISGVPVEFKHYPGRGISCRFGDGEWLFGSSRLLSESGVAVPEDYSLEKYSTIFMACNGIFAGVAAFSTAMLPNAAEAVKALSAMGIECVMLSGDNPASAGRTAGMLGIERVYAGLLPQDKLDKVRKLRSEGFLAMIGDGVNDAPALAGADIGIAVGRGADCACDAAGIVIAGNDVMQAVKAVKISVATMRIIKQNLFWAVFYNLFAIPAAAGVFVKLGIPEVPPAVCAGAMAASSLTVVLNASRLKGIKL